MNSMMRFHKLQSLSLAVVIGLATVFLSFALLGMTTSVFAQEQELTAQINSAPIMARPDIDFTVVFTDPAVYLVVYDLAGDPVGEGMHIGGVRCRGDNCNKNTQILFTIPPEGATVSGVEYRFTNRIAIDPDARRVIVQGVGTVYSDGQKERFSFVATFEDNRDGTVLVSYDASNPDVSFIIPKSPGIFEITRIP